MTVSTTLSSLESVGTSLAAAIGVTWPALVGTPAGESNADADRAMQLLRQLAQWRTGYAAQASAHNTAETLNAAYAANYTAALAAFNADVPASWATTHTLLLSAEAALSAEPWPGSWPGAAVTTNDVLALAARFLTVATAITEVPEEGDPARSAAVLALRGRMGAALPEIRRHVYIAALDQSAMAAEQELLDAGNAGPPWTPGTESSPRDVTTVAYRAKVAASACRSYPSLASIRTALLDGKRTLESRAATAPTQQTTPQPGAPSDSAYSPLVTEANRFLEYLQGS